MKRVLVLILLTALVTAMVPQGKVFAADEPDEPSEFTGSNMVIFNVAAVNMAEEDEGGDTTDPNAPDE